MSAWRRNWAKTKFVFGVLRFLEKFYLLNKNLSYGYNVRQPTASLVLQHLILHYCLELLHHSTNQLFSSSFVFLVYILNEVYFWSVCFHFSFRSSSFFHAGPKKNPASLLGIVFCNNCLDYLLLWPSFRQLYAYKNISLCIKVFQLSTVFSISFLF